MPILPLNEDILPLSDDYIFKAVMSHPDAELALMDLISACINRTVNSVQIRNNELPVTDTEEKNERLDLNCVIDDGSQVDVEMNASYIASLDGGHKGFMNKTVYYLTDLHSSQKSKGVKYNDFVRTYQITFSAHNIFNWPEYITEASLRIKSGYQLSDQIQIMFIELAKMSDILKKPVDQMTLFEMWSVFIGYADNPKHRLLINELLEKKEAIGMAGTVLTAISKDEKERAHLRSRRMYESDIISNRLTYMELGRREGIEIGKEQGIEIGIEKGIEKGTIDMVKKLKNSSIMSFEQISHISGLTLEEIEAL